MTDEDFLLTIEQFLRDKPLSGPTLGDWGKMIRTIARNVTEEVFLEQIELFLRRHPLSATTFGLWAMDDSRFVFDLRNGRRCYEATRTRVLRFMLDYEKKQEAKRSRNLNQR